MEKLKTLKDLQATATGLISEEELKAEAVKWVKYSEKKYNEKIENLDKDLALAHTTTIEWIKHFFNLTEEDLKDG